MNIFGNRWWLVVASILGLCVSSGVINVFAFGVFIKPISQELGLSRGELSLGLFMGSAMLAVFSPAIGIAVDRFGGRWTLIAGGPLFALSVLVFFFLPSRPLFLVYLLFASTGILRSAASPVPYAAMIARRFDRDRGLAMGIAMGGIGLGVAVVPELTSWFIAVVGWRLAYVCLAVTICALSWLPILLLPREQAKATGGPTPRPAASLPGFTIKQALTKSWRFWAISVAFGCCAAATNGILVHIVPLLTDRGVSPQTAIAALSVSGLAMIIGRVASGYLLDRFSGPAVAIGCFASALLGVGLIGWSGAGAGPYMGTLLCGLSIGAALGVEAFLATRYFGMRAYGKVYGVMYGIFILGSGAGPSIAGAIFDAAHAYTPAFYVFGTGLLIACGLVAPLGAYPFGAATAKRSTASAERKRVLALSAVPQLIRRALVGLAAVFADDVAILRQGAKSIRDTAAAAKLVEPVSISDRFSS